MIVLVPGLPAVTCGADSCFSGGGAGGGLGTRGALGSWRRGPDAHPVHALQIRAALLAFAAQAICGACVSIEPTQGAAFGAPAAFLHGRRLAPCVAARTSTRILGDASRTQLLQPLVPGPSKSRVARPAVAVPTVRRAVAAREIVMWLGALAPAACLGTVAIHFLLD